MWRILIPATLVGLAREYFLRKGWIPPDPGTEEEKRKYTERTIILSVIYSAISLFLLCSWLRWFVPGLWEQYFVVYTFFGACCDSAALKVIHRAGVKLIHGATV